MDPTALAGIATSVAARLGTALTDLKQAAPHWRLLLWALVIFGGLYGVAVIVFQGIESMQIGFWPAVIVGGLVGAAAVGLAWKHVQPPSPPAEAQTKKDEPKGSASGNSAGTTISSPGSINIFGGTVSNPTINNFPVPRPWALDTGQLTLLTQRMTPYASQRDRGDLVTCVLGDAESTRFALGLVSAFRQAHWNLPGSGFNQAVYSGNPEGITVQLHSKTSKPKALQELVATFREAGIEPVGSVDPQVPESEFRIIVGRRPQ